MSKSISRVVVGKPIAVVARESLEGAEPEIALRVLVSRSDETVRQPVARIVAPDGKLLGQNRRREQPGEHKGLASHPLVCLANEHLLYPSASTCAPSQLERVERQQSACFRLYRCHW